jgi:hypothetical protein
MRSELLPSHSGWRDRGVGRRYRNRGGSADSARRAQLLQCAVDDGPFGLLRYSLDAFADDGEVDNESTEAFLRDVMTEFRNHLEGF